MEASDRFELADVRRLGRRGLRRLVTTARKPVEAQSPDEVIADFLGSEAAGWPVVGEDWPTYDQVNVQVALDVWLSEQGREHRLVGLSQFQHRLLSLGDLAQPVDQRIGAPRVGSVSLTQLPAGPGGEVLSCVRCGLYLVTESDGNRLALLLFEGQDHGAGPKIHLEGLGRNPKRAAEALAELRALTIRHSVFRGQVLTFGREVFGRRGAASLTFQPRPHVERDALILPEGVTELIERQVLGVARHRDRLRASGQHLKRGLLLYGPPGTGKTHTVRYLLGRLSGVTVIVLSGNALESIAAACSIARTLQPAAVVVEDVDLIAEERGMRPGANPLLFQLLNEMDGLGEDVDVAFVLTTNRADLLEPALAARPGRIDQAVEVPLPDAAARRQLLEVYRGRLSLDSVDLDQVLARTEGVTASFLKEVLRRAALLGAENGTDTDELVINDADLTEALDELLDDRARLTRVILGG